MSISHLCVFFAQMLSFTSEHAFVRHVSSLFFVCLCLNAFCLCNFSCIFKAAFLNILIQKRQKLSFATKRHGNFCHCGIPALHAAGRFYRSAKHEVFQGFFEVFQT